MKRFLFLIVLGMLVAALAGCSAFGIEQGTLPTETSAGTDSEMGNGMGMGMGMGNAGMMERHHAAIPEEYATLRSPVEADEASLGRGQEIYTAHCAVCHGDGGMGDGPGGASLDPAPAPVARSSQMMGDGYLFWRISEGGAPFSTAMISFKETLDEQARWDVINYVRALGKGTVTPMGNMGGQTFDPTQQAQQHAEMLANGIDQGVITQGEADLFTLVHDLLDTQKTEGMHSMEGSMDEMQATMLNTLVLQGAITQEQADGFQEIHDRLAAAGLMQ